MRGRTQRLGPDHGSRVDSRVVLHADRDTLRERILGEHAVSPIRISHLELYAEASTGTTDSSRASQRAVYVRNHESPSRKEPAVTDMNFGDDPDVARLDPVALASALRGGLGAGAEQRERLAGLRGRAESSDGFVHVEVDPQGRLAEVRLDPKAMRMASVDLSAAIVRLAAEAGADVERQLRDEVGDLRQLAKNFDPATITSRMDDVSDDFTRMAANARAQSEDLQRRTR